ncbi:cell growth-regulating nucleolar [Cryptosporidium xiaoi]|uniref:Cell growth-regulating nucleolar n=1 Tax=Cryptosporidium xiaoi TaxID=659607 RepID=A0AAV9Y2K8_9CRYT
MVSFVCGDCQEVLKKSKIDSHCIVSCPDAWEFTCIDCNVTFQGFTYKSHSKCITEEEKYHGKFSKVSKTNSKMEKNNSKNLSSDFTSIINEILRINGSMSWKNLRDKSVNEYCKRNNVKVNNSEFRRKLNLECLASIPIKYTFRESNVIKLRDLP